MHHNIADKELAQIRHECVQVIVIAWLVAYLFGLYYIGIYIAVLLVLKVSVVIVFI